MNVRSIVTDTLTASGYASYSGTAPANAVVEALEAKIEEAVENLVTYATEQGLSEADARAALVDAGLVEAPAPTFTNAESVDSGVLARIEARLNALTDFARSHGFRG